MLSVQEVCDPETLFQVYCWDQENPVSRFLPLSWEDYHQKVTQPNWCHYGIYREGCFVACASVEAHGPLVWEAHISVARHAIKPQELRQAVLSLIQGAIQSGVQELFAFVPSIHRAAQRLCKACGMVLVEVIPTEIEVDMQPLSYLKFAYVKA